MTLRGILTNCILKTSDNWDLHIFGEVIPVNKCSHCKKFLSYVEIKPLLVQLVPVTSCLLHELPCEEKGTSILSVATF